jgi:glycogen operon protein
VSYNEKHNEANGEENRDGSNDNHSWNCGAEGPTDDAGIESLRQQQTRNFLATMFLSQGVPMLLSGDELGHSQRGNNNAYCQDNELTWIDWNGVSENHELLEFTQRLIRFHKEQPVLHRRSFFQGRAIRGVETTEITWFEPSGDEMTDDQWNAGFVRAFALRLSGDVIPEKDSRGNPIVGDTLVMFFNAHHEPLAFVLPAIPTGTPWRLALNTAALPPLESEFPSAATVQIASRSVAVFVQKYRAETHSETDNVPLKVEFDLTQLP